MSSTAVAATIAAASATAALIGTVANIIYQGRQFRDQRNVLKRQAELFGLQTEDLRESATQRRMQQAVLVQLDGWASRIVPKVGDKDGPPVTDFRRSDESALINNVRVVNGSNRPINNVQVRFGSDQAQWVRLNDGTITVRAPLCGLGPSRSAWFDSGYLSGYPHSVNMRFTDANDKSWQIDEAGNIKALDKRDW